MDDANGRVAIMIKKLIMVIIFPFILSAGSVTSASGGSTPTETVRWVDLDGDGVAESQYAAADDDWDGIIDHTSGPRSSKLMKESGNNPLGEADTRFPLEFEQMWDSGDYLNNVWQMAVYDFDGDNLMGIVSMAISPQRELYLFENSADNEFELIWMSGQPTPTGAFVTVTGGDSDRDGQGEIIAGETSLFNEVLLYEAVDNDSFVQRDIDISEYDPLGGPSMDKVLVADTDDDDVWEIIVGLGSVADGSMVLVYEQTGPPGQNTYTRVYEYETVSYLVDIAIGDSDNDGNQEIVLGFGGWGGFPMYLRRLEYNPELETYEHKMMEPGVTGLPLSPTVEDIDGDGLNELVMGSSDTGGGTLYIFEATTDDEYTSVYQSPVFFDGTVLTTAVGPVMGSPYPAIVAGSYGGELRLYGFDEKSYQLLLEEPITCNGSIRGLFLGLVDGDERPDIVFSSMGDDRVYVYEQITPPVVRIDLVPFVTTVPRGSNLEFSIALANSTPDTQAVWGLTGVIFPAGDPYPVIGPVPLTLQSFEMVEVSLSHPVPYSAPLGIYLYMAAVGLPPYTLIDWDYFGFEVVESLR
ncbi:MAG: hypothetical protein ACE5OP_13825 [Candidatus Glassbacteria bacterium]